MIRARRARSPLPNGPLGSAAPVVAWRLPTLYTQPDWPRFLFGPILFTNRVDGSHDPEKSRIRSSATSLRTSAASGVAFGTRQP